LNKTLLHENNDFIISRIGKNIYCLEFDDQIEMAKTFIRFQEYYECPNKEFRKRHFTLKKFFDWYKEYRPGHDYYSEWDGYNFPSRDFKAFINGKFNPLRHIEKPVVDFFRKVRGKYYIIACIKGDQSTINHEMAHAFYDNDPVYRQRVHDIIGEYNIRAQYKILKDLGYASRWYRNELNAILSTSSLVEINTYGFKVDRELINRLRELYKKTKQAYFNE